MRPRLYVPRETCGFGACVKQPRNLGEWGAPGSDRVVGRNARREFTRNAATCARAPHAPATAAHTDPGWSTGPGPQPTHGPQRWRPAHRARWAPGSTADPRATAGGRA